MSCRTVLQDSFEKGIGDTGSRVGVGSEVVVLLMNKERTGSIEWKRWLERPCSKLGRAQCVVSIGEGWDEIRETGVGALRRQALEEERVAKAHNNNEWNSHIL